MLWWLLLLSACKRDATCPDAGEALVCDGDDAITCVDGKRQDRERCDLACEPTIGCIGCDLSLPPSLTVPYDPAPLQGPWQTLRWRSVAIPGAGTATLQLDGPLEVTDADGTPLSSVELPATVRVRGLAGGSGTLTVSVTGCEAPAAIALTVRRDPGLSATPRAAGAPVSYVDAFPVDSTVRLALDPVRHADREGETPTAYVVPDRDREAWLTPVDLPAEAIAAVPFEVLAAETTVVELLTGTNPGDGAIGRWDVVVDFDGDGALSPGDVLDGLDGPGFTLLPRMHVDGPHGVETTEVSASFFLTQRIYWPAELPTFEAPAPLVVISHGNGHEYHWYDYLGEHLASWGYVVMSHRNDTQAGVQAAATTTLENTDLFAAEHGEIDPDLEGRVDLSRIVWIGHSRGAEGIALAHERLRSGAASVDAFGPDDVVLLSSIAPTVFEDPRDASAGPTPYHVLSGSADGDVTGGVGSFFAPCPLCQWWRLLQTARDTQYVTYLHGATHNDFNCCGVNDGFGVDGPKLGRGPTQRYVKALYLALLRATLEGDSAFEEALNRSPDDLPLPLPEPFLVATQARISRTAGGVFVETFQDNSDPALSSSGTAVRHTLADYVEARLDDSNLNFTSLPGDPMNGMTLSDNDGAAIAERGAVFSWDGDATWEVDLPEGTTDLTGRAHIALRVAQGTRHPNTTALDDTLAFSVTLIDGAGGEVTIPTAAYGRITTPYPRGGLGQGRGWANEWNTLRIPTTDFESLGLELSDVRTLRLGFGPSFGSPQGRLGLDDVALEDR